ncbi:MAG: ABC transporter ATP-binding protein [Erysipelothrix sp.]|nr:ABC transporter ATP-binding protein [Erysipelothrix sp.]
MKKHNFGNKKHFILFAFVALFLAIGNGLLLLNIGKFTDASLARNLPLMLSLLKTMTIVFAFITLFEFLTNYISKKHLEESMVDLKVDYMENVLKRTPIFLSKAKSSQFVSNLTSDADRLELQYYMEIQEIIHTIFQFIISCILLTSISTYFIPVILLLAFIFISISSKTGETIKKDESKKSKSLVKFTAFIE